jgi:hypothetical protein
VDGELVWRNAELYRVEEGTGILLLNRIEVYVGCPQLLQANAGISLNTLC